MEIKCSICEKNCATISELASHIKSHRIAQKRYFEKYFPRRDLFNQKAIDFKSLEQYFLSDFVDKTSLKAWLKYVGPEKSKAYLARKIQKYCQIKKIDYALPEFFIQTIPFLPSIRFMEQLCDSDYNSIVEAVDLTPRYDYSNLKFRANNWREAKQIVIDTREKRPIKFNASLRKINIALDYGDYALSPASRIAIERKSLGDFYGTFGPNYERFERELIRAKENDGYIVIMTECSYSNLVYNKIRQYGASPEFVFHRVRDLYKRYDCFQVVFADGRRHMTDIIPKILGLGAEVRNIDLQHCLEARII